MNLSERQRLHLYNRTVTAVCVPWIWRTWAQGLVLVSTGDVNWGWGACPKHKMETEMWSNTAAWRKEDRLLALILLLTLWMVKGSRRCPKYATLTRITCVQALEKQYMPRRGLWLLLFFLNAGDETPMCTDRCFLCRRRKETFLSPEKTKRGWEKSLQINLVSSPYLPLASPRIFLTFSQWLLFVPPNI